MSDGYSDEYVNAVDDDRKQLKVKLEQKDEEIKMYKNLLANMQMQMGELKFHYSMRGERLEQLEQQLYDVTTPTRCKEAEIIEGKCRGYQKARLDDEPSEVCKECKKFELYEGDE